MKKSLLFVPAFAFISNSIFAEDKVKEEPAAISHHTIVLNHYKDGSVQIDGAHHNHYAPEKGHTSEQQAILFSDRLFRASKNAVKKTTPNTRPVEKNTKPVLTQIVSETPTQHAQERIQAQTTNIHTNSAPIVHREVIDQPSNSISAIHTENVTQPISTE